MANYSEDLFAAIDTVIKKRVDSITFDTTVDAIIINANKAEKGIYTVEIEDSSFQVYSNNTSYKKGDQVLVTIPQGDYNRQKFIIGKKINEDTNKTITFNKLALDNFFGNLIENNNITGTSFSLCEFYPNNNETPAVIDNNLNSNRPTPINKDDITLYLLWKTRKTVSEIQRITQYSRIGLKADFMTNIPLHKQGNGDYGLALEFNFKNEYDDRIYTSSAVLDSSHFLGDKYNLNFYRNQSIVFDISSYKDYMLTSISLYGYQKNNFVNEDGTSLINRIISNELPPIKICIKQPQIFLGEIVEDYSEPFIRINFPEEQSNYYSKLRIVDIIPQRDKRNKNITYFEENTENNNNYYTKYIFDEENNNSWTYQKLDEITQSEALLAENKKTFNVSFFYEDKKTKKTIIINEGLLPNGYKINWYKYQEKTKREKPIDEFINDIHWERWKTRFDYLTLAEAQLPTEDYNDFEEQYLSIIKQQSCEGSSSEKTEYDQSIRQITDGSIWNLNINEDKLASNYVLYPNVANNKEKIKVILLKKKEDVDSYEKLLEQDIEFSKKIISSTDDLQENLSEINQPIQLKETNINTIEVNELLSAEQVKINNLTINNIIFTIKQINAITKIEFNADGTVQKIWTQPINILTNIADNTTPQSVEINGATIHTIFP